MEKSILLIEDNELTRKLIEKFIELNNYKTIIAENAEDALNILRERSPDLILTDIMLPGMSGIDFVRAVREHPEYKDIPIIVLSAFSTDTDIREAFYAGCTDYIVKPIDINEFSTKLKKYLEDNS